MSVFGEYIAWARATGAVQFHWAWAYNNNVLMFVTKSNREKIKWNYYSALRFFAKGNEFQRRLALAENVLSVLEGSSENFSPKKIPSTARARCVCMFWMILNNCGLLVDGYCKSQACDSVQIFLLRLSANYHHSILNAYSTDWAPNISLFKYTTLRARVSITNSIHNTSSVFPLSVKHIQYMQ